MKQNKENDIIQEAHFPGEQIDITKYKILEEVQVFEILKVKISQ